MMRRKIWNEPAPSTRAASKSSRSIPWSPARMRIAQNGVIFQTSARTTIHIAVLSWESHGM